MYLSANPLDPYYMEITYGCNSSIKEINEGIKEENRLYTFGGMVTSFETRPSRKGGSYGRMMIEDYTGSTEIMLFNKDYIQFANYGKPSAQLIIAGKYERAYNNELRFRIQTIKLLEDVKGKLISGITVKVTPDEITDSLIDLFREASLRETTGRGSLTVEVYDPKINRTVKMLSGLKVPIDHDFVEMLDGLNLKYDFSRTVN